MLDLAGHLPRARGDGPRTVSILLVPDAIAVHLLQQRCTRRNQDSHLPPANGTDRFGHGVGHRAFLPVPLPGPSLHLLHVFLVGPPLRFLIAAFGGCGLALAFVGSSLFQMRPRKLVPLPVQPRRDAPESLLFGICKEGVEGCRQDRDRIARSLRKPSERWNQGVADSPVSTSRASSASAAFASIRSRSQDSASWSAVTPEGVGASAVEGGSGSSDSDTRSLILNLGIGYGIGGA